MLSPFSSSYYYLFVSRRKLKRIGNELTVGRSCDLRSPPTAAPPLPQARRALRFGVILRPAGAHLFLFHTNIPAYHQITRERAPDISLTYSLTTLIMASDASRRYVLFALRCCIYPSLLTCSCDAVLRAAPALLVLGEDGPPRQQGGRPTLHFARSKQCNARELRRTVTPTSPLGSAAQRKLKI